MKKTHEKSKMVTFNLDSNLANKLFEVDDWKREYVILQTEMLPSCLSYEMIAEIVAIKDYELGL